MNPPTLYMGGLAFTGVYVRADDGAFLAIPEITRPLYLGTDDDYVLLSVEGGTTSIGRQFCQDGGNIPHQSGPGGILFRHTRCDTVNIHGERLSCDFCQSNRGWTVDWVAGERDQTARLECEFCSYARRGKIASDIAEYMEKTSPFEDLPT